MMAANTIVMALATIMAVSPSKQPYTSHRLTPIVKHTYMLRDNPAVFRVRITLMAWGTNAMVVQVAASKPIDSVISGIVRCLFVG
jgi:hypothetical protein